MDSQRKPRAREKKVTENGKGVEKRGEGLGTGPVNNMGNYANRREQHAHPSQPTSVNNQRASARPGGIPHQQINPPYFQQHPQTPNVNPPRKPGYPGGIPMSGPSQSARPSQAPKTGSQTGGNTYGTDHHNSTVQHKGTQRSSGGSGKLLLIIAAVIILFGGGKFSGLLDGGEEILSPSAGQNTVQNTVQNALQNEIGNTGAVSSLPGQFGSAPQNQISDLLSLLMGSGSSSVYDFNGSSVSSPATGVSSGDSQADETVSAQAREKFTRILGNNQDTVTLLVYMCGTDLESQNGMGTSDLKEMAKAKLGKNVNLLVYTGGCRSWRNNVVSSRVNQIYQIKDGGLFCLEENMGSGSMTTPSTLTEFIQYGKEHFPANRFSLILWDHGGGSVSGYGYDEKNGRSSMTLAGINTALKNADTHFDFIGFDACLMATVENGLMLSQYADYMIASEETEPGVGWYYTNWLNKLAQNTSMPTVQIGKQIADDFISVCSQQCRGQATTLSVVDLAELQGTLPSVLKTFSTGTNDLIQKKQYKTVSTARANTREFAQSTRIDQIDLVHFAKNLKTQEGLALADALEKAVKYNRTGGGMTDAYGLSIYFPYKKAGNVSKMVSTYEAIGMDAEYTRCIQAFASMEVSGQVASGGTPISYYSSAGPSNALPGLMGSLLGGTGSSYGSSYSQDSLSDVLGSLFGGSSSGMGGTGLLDLFSARSLSQETAAAYILDNHLDTSELVWQDGRITLSGQQWGLIESIVKNIFVDDGKGFIDLGCDNDFILEGNDLVGDYDGTWLSIDGQPVAYYYLSTMENGEDYRISGYVPAYLNDVRVNLMLIFDNEHPYGYIAGAQKVYGSGETEVQAKNMIQVGKGDEVRFLCDYFDYEGNYQDTFQLGEALTLGDQVEITNTPLGNVQVDVTYCLTDLYQQQYWTPVFR